MNEIFKILHLMFILFNLTSNQNYDFQLSLIFIFLNFPHKKCLYRITYDFWCGPVMYVLLYVYRNLQCVHHRSGF